MFVIVVVVVSDGWVDMGLRFWDGIDVDGAGRARPDCGDDMVDRLNSVSVR